MIEFFGDGWVGCERPTYDIEGLKIAMPSRGWAHVMTDEKGLAQVLEHFDEQEFETRHVFPVVTSYVSTHDDFNYRHGEHQRVSGGSNVAIHVIGHKA
jgi:hypothetical protein